jgi:hypothetical protein
MHTRWERSGWWMFSFRFQLLPPMLGEDDRCGANSTASAS